MRSRADQTCLEQPRNWGRGMTHRIIRSSRIAACLLFAVAALSVAACGESEDDGSDGSARADAPAKPSKPPPHDPAEVEDVEPGSGKGLKLGYISLDESNAFWSAAGKGIREQIERSGATGVYCDSERTPEGALNCARNLKTQGVDGYIITQQDPNATERICAAGPQNVPVISFDVLQEPCSKTLAGANNRYAGYIAGRALGMHFLKEFNCEYDAYVSLEALDAGKLNQDRMGGYREGFSSVCGPIHDERKENAITADQTRPVVTNILTSLPAAERIAVVAVDDDGLVGAFAAAKAANRDGDIHGSGQGVQPFAFCPILDHPDNWVGSAAYFNEDWGRLTVPYLIKAVKGEQIPESLEIGHQVLNADNLTKFYPDAAEEC
jgi:ribose transport system substrate-binding protein